MLRSLRDAVFLVLALYVGDGWVVNRGANLLRGLITDVSWLLQLLRRYSDLWLLLCVEDRLLEPTQIILIVGLKQGP